MEYQLEELRQVSLPKRFLCFPLFCCGVCLCGCGLDLARPLWAEHAERAKGPINSGAQGGLATYRCAARVWRSLSSHTSVDSTQPRPRVVIVGTMASPGVVGPLFCGRCNTSDRGLSPPPQVELCGRRRLAEPERV